MKKFYPALLFINLLISSFSFSQSIETWEWQGYSIGQDAIGNAYSAENFMPEVLKIGSQYIMYYTGRYNNTSAILYATSPDLSSWNIKDTILVGFSDTTNREYEIGGASVIKTTDGKYRLFYRCSPKIPNNSVPEYHIRSAISIDGINFTREGICIEIQPYDTNSYFTLAGQSAFYRDKGGNMRTIISGIDTSLNSGPAQLYLASSSDEGLTWTNFTPLYAGSHDPVVIMDSSGTYHAYFSYLSYGHRKCESPDGAAWPQNPDSILLKQGSNYLTEESTPFYIADIGAVVDSLGNIILYSNYKSAGNGPWENICYYNLQTITKVDKLPNKQTMVVSPNPSSNYISFKFSFATNREIKIYNIQGELVYQNISNLEYFSVSIESWSSGIYYYQIKQGDEFIALDKILVQ